MRLLIFAYTLFSDRDLDCVMLRTDKIYPYIKANTSSTIRLMKTLNIFFASHFSAPASLQHTHIHFNKGPQLSEDWTCTDPSAADVWDCWHDIRCTAASSWLFSRPAGQNRLSAVKSAHTTPSTSHNHTNLSANWERTWVYKVIFLQCKC